VSRYRTSFNEPEDIFCGWGRCQLRPVPGLGVCKHHAVTAFLWVQRQMATLEEQARAGSKAAADELHRRRPANNEWRQGLIYALSFGSLIKIGFTTNLPQRLADLPHDELLGTMPGTLGQERKLHKSFDEHRHKLEWYRDVPEIRAFIAENMTRQDEDVA
jgi:hypothetical protein